MSEETTTQEPEPQAPPPQEDSSHVERFVERQQAKLDARRGVKREEPAETPEAPAEKPPKERLHLGSHDTEAAAEAFRRRRENREATLTRERDDAVLAAQRYQKTFDDLLESARQPEPEAPAIPDPNTDPNGWIQANLDQKLKPVNEYFAEERQRRRQQEDSAAYQERVAAVHDGLTRAIDQWDASPAGLGFRARYQAWEDGEIAHRVNLGWTQEAAAKEVSEFVTFNATGALRQGVPPPVYFDATVLHRAGLVPGSSPAVSKGDGLDQTPPAAPQAPSKVQRLKQAAKGSSGSLATSDAVPRVPDSDPYKAMQAGASVAELKVALARDSGGSMRERLRKLRLQARADAERA